MSALTPVQAKVLDYYRERITRGGFTPTQVEAGKHFGVSTMRVNTILRQLERQGHLVRHPNRQRGIELAGVVSLVGVSSADLRAELARRGETLDALDGGERSSLRRGAVTCAADCCQREVTRGKLFCRAHWFALPERLRRDILDAFGAKDVERYQEAVATARDLIDTGLYSAPRDWAE